MLAPASRNYPATIEPDVPGCAHGSVAQF